VRQLALWLGCCGVTLAVAAHTRAAEAAESNVKLQLRGCAALSESALREHLELELATLELTDANVQLLLSCDQSSVAIELRRASGARYPVQVRVELRDTAKPARERLVALAASELIAQAERAQVNQPPASAAAAVRQTPASPSVDRDTTTPAARRRPPIELFVAGNAALDGAPNTALWGGSLGTRWGLSRTWSVLFDTRFERGQQSLRLALGEVRWTLLSGFVGAGANVEVGPLRLSAGLGIRAGWLALAATTAPPNEGRSFTAPWAGVAVPLRLAMDLGGIVLPFVGAEAGYVLAPVRGKVDDGSVLVEQRGPWLAGSVGVAVVL
jgi:hypothetical protein